MLAEEWGAFASATPFPRAIGWQSRLRAGGRDAPPPTPPVSLLRVVMYL